MKKYIIENGVYANFTQMQKNAVKTEALLSGNNKYKGVKSICIITSDDFDIETVYAAAKEKYVAWSKGQYKMYDKYIEVTEPATVQSEVKAAEVKETEEETEMSAMFTAEQVAALVLAASKGTTTPVVETVPADYETLKKTAATWQSKYTEAAKELAELQKKYDKLVAEMSASKPVESEKHFPSKKEELQSVTADYDDLVETDNDPFNEKFCADNKAFKEEEVKKEMEREDCLFGDDFLFSTDWREQLKALREIVGYTGHTEGRTTYACKLNRDKKISFTNGYEFVAELTKLTMSRNMWEEIVADLTTDREGTNVLSKNVRSQLKAYYKEGLSIKEIGEAMSMVE